MMKTAEGTATGEYEAAFRPVVDAFKANFDEGFEVGASCCVHVDGKPVVDIWGGHMDDTRARPWERDTVVNLMSIAKGVASLCIHRMAGEGLIDLDALVSIYWPEFAENGKGDVLVRHCLDHRAGIPIVEDPMWKGAVYDRDAMIRAIEKQRPIFPAGEQPAYHTIVMSFLLGELARRVTGQPLPAYFREHIGEPLKLDYWLGLPPGEDHRCARFMAWTGYNTKTGEKDAPPDLLIKAWQQFDPAHDDNYNSETFRRAELPAVNGHGNARAIARLYAALAAGGEIDGVRIIKPEALKRAVEMQWFAVEPVLTHNYRMGMGFTLNSPDAFMGPNLEAFGHVGAGGSTGFADPVAGIGFSYGMNRMYPTRDNGPRARRLIEATYRCL
ncbi:MAG TPA: serine hydrolase domain-containing protein [Bauldia sp.]|nr:serine hydrolase domain-containing protein [Bauldia sp.]